MCVACATTQQQQTSTSPKFCLHNSANDVYMAMEVAQSVELNDSAADGREQTLVEENDAMADYSPLSETNDDAVAARADDDTVEERFRVDRRKLEQLIQGMTRRRRKLASDASVSQERTLK